VALLLALSVLLCLLLIVCKEDKHNYWRAPCGEITCDCGYMALCIKLVKKFYGLTIKTKTGTKEVR
jgi:hypothetical protein